MKSTGLSNALPEHIVVVFDEAYFEYLDDPPDTLRFVREGRNVAVLRTFSKIQGLANLRIGYGIARPELIQVLQKTRQPFNVNGLAQTAALAGLQDEEHQLEDETHHRRRPRLFAGRIRGDESPLRPERGQFRPGESR